MKIDAPHRSLAKSLSWRIFSLMITFCVTLLITGSTRVAVSVSALDTLIKICIYYLHERLWVRVRWGRLKIKKNKKHKKHKKAKHQYDGDNK